MPHMITHTSQMGAATNAKSLDQLKAEIIASSKRGYPILVAGALFFLVLTLLPAIMPLRTVQLTWVLGLIVIFPTRSRERLSPTPSYMNALRDMLINFWRFGWCCGPLPIPLTFAAPRACARAQQVHQGVGGTTVLGREQVLVGRGRNTGCGRLSHHRVEPARCMVDSKTRGDHLIGQ
jgi:hypothetical protein